MRKSVAACSADIVRGALTTRDQLFTARDGKRDCDEARSSIRRSRDESNRVDYLDGSVRNFNLIARERDFLDRTNRLERARMTSDDARCVRLRLERAALRWWNLG